MHLAISEYAIILVIIITSLNFCEDFIVSERACVMAYLHVFAIANFGAEHGNSEFIPAFQMAQFNNMQ